MTPAGGPSGPVTVGVDVGGTKILGVALDGADRVVAEVRLPTPSPPGPAVPGGSLGSPARDRAITASGVVAVVAEAVAELIGDVGRASDAVRAVGVGMPGLIGTEGDLRFAPNLSQGVGATMARELSPLVASVPVVADNDATCATLAESTLGAARGTSHAVVITFGTGIGSGLVVGGRVNRGTNGYAGEVGHMVIDPHGPVCACGKRGCWERYASGSGLGRLAREAAQAGRLSAVVHRAGGDPELVRGEHVTEAAAAGDAEACAVLEELARWLALGLANLAEVLDPSLFVLGGGLMEAGALLLDPARAAFHDLVERRDGRPPVAIVPAALGERAGAVGAAMVARTLLDP